MSSQKMALPGQCPFLSGKLAEGTHASAEGGKKRECPYLSAPMKAASGMQTACQGPLNPKTELKPLSKEEQAQAKAELEAIKKATGWEEPDRGATCKDDAVDEQGRPIEWRFGQAPDYTLANLEYFKYKVKHHPAGSLEQVVENLVKTWEFERSHKTDASQHTIANHEGFFLSANQGKKFSHAEAHEVGNYNALLESADPQLWDNEKITNRDSHDIFHGAFPAFAWEILKVYTGPPVVYFEWRHFGRFTGIYKNNRGNGEMIDVRGYGIATVNDKLQLMDTQVFYDQESFLKVLEGKLPASALGHPYDPSRTCMRAIDDVSNYAAGSKAVKYVSPYEADAALAGVENENDKLTDSTRDSADGANAKKPSLFGRMFGGCAANKKTNNNVTGN